MSDEMRAEQWDDVATEQARRSMAAAHRPGSAVAGPYGHPVHPLLVTIPIGAFVATLAFDIASVTVEGRAYGRPAVWLSAIGIVSAIVASLFGFLDFRRLTSGTRAHAVAVRHMVLMDVVLVCFIVGFFIRRADETQYLDGTPVAALVLSAVGVAVLVVGGWLGGRLAFSFGSRVADEQDQLPAHVILSKGASTDAAQE
jgi:uncharacterized membrane protein